MGRSCFLRVLLVLALLALSFSHGISTKVMETVEITRDFSVQAEESGGKSRELMEEMMDYQLEPGPNTNPTTGSMLAPPPQR